MRLAMVLAGIILGQFLLYGPSLIGRKVLLPLHCLAIPRYYLPDSPQTPNLNDDPTPSDLVLLFEPDRRFASSEFSAGRFPLWATAEFGGVPFIWPKYSPFFLFSCLTASPVILAWTQLLAALVAGAGAYRFARTVLHVSFWPAAIAAWSYPMIGFFSFWQGYPTSSAVYWLPWLLLAVDGTVRGRSVVAPMVLVLVTALTLVSGHIDTAALVLVVSGLFALWGLYDVYGRRLFQRATSRIVFMLMLGWGLGFLLAAPGILPVMEYVKTSQRMTQRLVGQQERPRI